MINNEEQLREQVARICSKHRYSDYSPLRWEVLSRDEKKPAFESADQIHALYLEWLKQEGWRSKEEVQELRCESREWGIKKGRGG